MPHDLNKPPHVNSAEDTKRKKRIPVYMLVLVIVNRVQMKHLLDIRIQPYNKQRQIARLRAQLEMKHVRMTAILQQQQISSFT